MGQGESKYHASGPPRQQQANYRQKQVVDMNNSFSASAQYSSVYQRRRPSGQETFEIQPRSKVEPMTHSVLRANRNMSNNNGADTSFSSQLKRNKSSNLLRGQVSFNDESSSKIRSLSRSPSRSELFVSSIRDVSGKKRFRKRHQVPMEEKLQLINEACGFSADVAMSSIQYDNNAFINSLPALTGMISSEFVQPKPLAEQAHMAKQILKNKAQEELFLREHLKNDYPFYHSQGMNFSKIKSSFIDEKYGNDQYQNSQLSQPQMLVESNQPFFGSKLSQGVSGNTDLQRNTSQLEFSQSQSEILPSRQTFKALVPSGQPPVTPKKDAFKFTDLFKADQQLSAPTTKKPTAAGATSEFYRQESIPDEHETAIVTGIKSNNIKNTASFAQDKKQSDQESESQVIAIMPVKTNAEVQVQPKVNVSKLQQVKTTIEINERITEAPGGGYVGGSNIVENPRNNISGVNRNQEEQSSLEFKRQQQQQQQFTEQQKMLQQQQEDQEQYFQQQQQQQYRPQEPLQQQNQQQQQQPYYIQPQQALREQFPSNLSHSPSAPAFFQNNNNNSSQLNSYSQQQTAPLFFATYSKLRVEANREDIPENSPRSQYDQTQSSEEDSENSLQSEALRLRTYEQNMNKKNKQMMGNSSYVSQQKNGNSRIIYDRDYNGNNQQQAPLGYQDNNQHRTTTTENSYMTYTNKLSDYSSPRHNNNLMTNNGFQSASPIQTIPVDQNLRSSNGKSVVQRPAAGYFKTTPQNINNNNNAMNMQSSSQSRQPGYLSNSRANLQRNDGGAAVQEEEIEQEYDRTAESLQRQQKHMFENNSRELTNAMMANNNNNQNSRSNIQDYNGSSLPSQIHQQQQFRQFSQGQQQRQDEMGDEYNIPQRNELARGKQVMNPQNFIKVVDIKFNQQDIEEDRGLNKSREQQQQQPQQQQRILANPRSQDNSMIQQEKIDGARPITAPLVVEAERQQKQQPLQQQQQQQQFAQNPTMNPNNGSYIKPQLTPYQSERQIQQQQPYYDNPANNTSYIRQQKQFPEPQQQQQQQQFQHLQDSCYRAADKQQRYYDQPIGQDNYNNRSRRREAQVADDQYYNNNMNNNNDSYLNQQYEHTQGSTYYSNSQQKIRNRGDDEDDQDYQEVNRNPQSSSSSNIRQVNYQQQQPPVTSQVTMRNVTSSYNSARMNYQLPQQVLIVDSPPDSQREMSLRRSRSNSRTQSLSSSRVSKRKATPGRRQFKQSDEFDSDDDDNRDQTTNSTKSKTLQSFTQDYELDEQEYQTGQQQQQQQLQNQKKIGGGQRGDNTNKVKSTTPYSQSGMVRKKNNIEEISNMYRSRNEGDNDYDDDDNNKEDIGYQHHQQQQQEQQPRLKDTQVGNNRQKYSRESETESDDLSRNPFNISKSNNLLKQSARSLKDLSSPIQQNSQVMQKKQQQQEKKNNRQQTQPEQDEYDDDEEEEKRIQEMQRLRELQEQNNSEAKRKAQRRALEEEEIKLNQQKDIEEASRRSQRENFRRIERDKQIQRMDEQEDDNDQQQQQNKIRGNGRGNYQDQQQFNHNNNNNNNNNSFVKRTSGQQQSQPQQQQYYSQPLNSSLRRQQQQQQQPEQLRQPNNQARQQPQGVGGRYGQNPPLNSSSNRSVIQNGSDSDTDTAMPHQDIDAHVYPQAKQLNTSQTSFVRLSTAPSYIDDQEYLSQQQMQQQQQQQQFKNKPQQQQQQQQQPIQLASSKQLAPFNAGASTNSQINRPISQQQQQQPSNRQYQQQQQMSNQQPPNINTSQYPQQQQQQYQQPQQSTIRQPQRNNIDSYNNNINNTNEDDIVRFKLDLSNAKRSNQPNNNNRTLDGSEMQSYNDDPLKVQVTLSEIFAKEGSGFFDEQGDLLASDSSVDKGNYLNALNQNLLRQNKHLL